MSAADTIDVLSDRRMDVNASYFGFVSGVSQWCFPPTIHHRGVTYQRETPRLSDDGELVAMHYTAMSSIGQILLVVWND